MSRSKQESLLLEERIEKIRRKNEEIKRRHEEVEADKQNAAKLNALVQVSAPTEDWTTGGKLQSHHQSSVKVKFSEQQSHIEGSGRGRPKEQTECERPQSGINAKKTGAPKCYTFREGDGPPPDPSYRFLADVERDSDRNFQAGRRGRGGYQRGSFVRERGRGGSYYRGGHSNGGRPEGDASRMEYEVWRAERNRIDSDRISRQKTAEGHWRREWDSEKIVQEEEDFRGMPREAKFSTPRRTDRKSYNENARNTPKENYRFSGASDEGSSRVQEFLTERGGSNRKGERQNRNAAQGYKPFPFQQNTSKREESNSDSWDDDTHKQIDRSVVSVGESIKICIRNSPSPTVSTGSAVKSVKVNPPVIAGTGRVGPRQRVRVSYSSQSEDETVQQTPRSRPSRSAQQHQNAKNVQIQSGNESTAPVKPQQSSQSHSMPEPLPESPLTKPPLPPLPASKHEDTFPKPRRQRNRKLENEKTKKYSEKKAPGAPNEPLQELQEQNKADDQSLENTDKSTGNDSECGGDGDDSWEDINTTSGNESVPEYPDEDSSQSKRSVRSVSFQGNKIQICFQKDEEVMSRSSEENFVTEVADDSYIHMQESSNVSISSDLSEYYDKNDSIITNIEKIGEKSRENDTSEMHDENKEKMNKIHNLCETSRDDSIANECQRSVTCEKIEETTDEIVKECQQVTVEEKQPEAVDSQNLLDAKVQNNIIVVDHHVETPDTVDKTENVNENIPLTTGDENKKDSILEKTE